MEDKKLHPSKSTLSAAINSIHSYHSSLQSNTTLQNAFQDHHSTGQGTHLNSIDSRLLEMDMKINRLEYTFQEAFTRMEQHLEQCYQAIEQVNESIVKLTRKDPALEEQNVVVNVKLGGKEIKLTRNPGSKAESLTEKILTSSSSETSGKEDQSRLGSVFSKLKHRMKNAFSVPCIVTPIFEIYPAKVFSKTTK
ncbi:uncharacterized protein LOC131693165 [Topomyia yanbarensis]|uniref:uncharacterized protein LOC131693165 n=1 Tax=Topomyia yanbarensis TaxID=2498891 RepID=UPI00273CF087|nr:uncharacterized protein LOC131693165 [Topomyia yanbarensis]